MEEVLKEILAELKKINEKLEPHQIEVKLSGDSEHSTISKEKLGDLIHLFNGEKTYPPINSASDN